MKAEFFETFKLLNGQLCNPEFHLARIRKTQAAFFSTAGFEINEVYATLKDYPEGLFKVRVDYDSSITGIRADLYEIQPHRKLGIAEAGDFDYAFKFADRDFFSKSLEAYPDCDDVLFLKNGFITDTSYCNVALFNGEEWITPSDFLLPGTKRAALIHSGVLREAPVTLSDLPGFEAIAFINAMRDFEKKYTFVKDRNEFILAEI
ncbi:Amino-transferase class IV [compost metagenome]